MKFTRKEVLRAIDTENLKAGTFIYTRDNKPYEECKVCIVGALVREKMNKDNSPMFLEDICNDLTNHNVFGVCHFYMYALDEILKEKEYLQALSIKFEFLCKKYKTMKPVRRLLKEWVKTNIPVSFEVSR
jgi:hypothetical protein